MRLLMAAVVAAALGTNAQAVNINFDDGGVDNEFSTALNWDNDLVPTMADTAVIESGFTVNRSVDSNVQRVAVRGGATLEITGGTHSDSLTGASTRNDLGRGSVGTVNQSGGSYDIGHSLNVGSAAGGNGTYNLTGGDLILSRGANSRIDDSLGRPSLDVGEVAADAGLFEISGGSLNTRLGAVIGETGTFSVVGSNATSPIGIGSHSTLDGWWIQQPGGILSAAVDAGGLTSIHIDELDGDNLLGGNGDVIFRSGSLLDVSFVDSEVLGSFTVMTWDGNVTDDGLAFAPGVDTNSLELLGERQQLDDSSR